ncbi:MAG: substrate-binding domain-containing protein [Alcanivoracaceae bacterium]|nr:substrate-binding domain-containing protein [Alcanivoracaceae bacterium]
MKLKATLAGLATVLAITSAPAVAASRDTISIVGSSTVYPFSTTVAERFGKGGKFATPKVESTGTGGGMKLFCAGVGTEHADMTGASRRMKKSEFDTCQANGVKDIVEMKIGFDGIVVANSAKGAAYQLSLKDIFLALAKDVPNADGTALIPNPNKTWKDVNPALPADKIEVLGPPPTSGTRDAFNELAMEGGCAKIPMIKAMKDTDKKKFEAVCRGIREDGHYIEAGENDNLIVQKLDANPKALGIFGYSFLDQNRGKVQGSIVDGVEPTFDNIASGEYPVSRSMYVYTKKAHIGVIPGITEYLAEFASEKAWGDEGYLTDKGLIPMPKADRQAVAKSVKALTLLNGSAL